MNKILLLGGTGFIGKTLLHKLEQYNSTKVMIHNTDLQTTAQKFKGDILNKKWFFDEIRNDETIINLLGQLTSNESDCIKSNILVGLNLLNSCVDKKIRQVILISSINVYGENLKRSSKETDPSNPESNYGKIKMITEEMYKNFSETYGINVTVLRLAGIYGPNGNSGFLTQIIKSIKNKNIIPVCYNN